MKSPSPACDAVTTHDPADTNDTTPSEIEHTPASLPSTSNVTGVRPLDATAAGAYDPPTTGSDGTADENDTTCDAFPTVTVNGAATSRATKPSSPARTADTTQSDPTPVNSTTPAGDTTQPDPEPEYVTPPEPDPPTTDTETTSPNTPDNTGASASPYNTPGNTNGA